MSGQRLQRSLCLLTGALFVGALTVDADARGGRGGGFARGGGADFSRSGPAAGGSFAARPAEFGSVARTQSRQQGFSERTATRQDTRASVQGDLQGERTERVDIRQSNRTERADGRQDVQINRQDEITQRQSNRQRAYDDHHDDHWDNWGPWGYAAAGAAVVAGAYAVGTVISAATYGALSCAPTTVIVGGVTYSRCGTTWYQPTYGGGGVTYIVVAPPPGY